MHFRNIEGHEQPPPPYRTSSSGEGSSLPVMEILGVVLGVALGFIFSCCCLLRWNEVRYRKKGLPPGTMGWPVFGETTEFLKQGPNFMKNQRARYGDLFKSHILGCPTVVCMDPELNRYILMNEAKGLVPGYPQSMLDILGECNIAAVHGPLHKAIRSAMLRLISPSMIGLHLLPKIDKSMRSHLRNWSGQTIDIQGKTKEMWLLSALKQIFSIETGAVFESLKSEMFKLVLGTLSIPINFPGTNYHHGFKSRKRIVSILKSIIKERRASPRLENDILDSLLRNDDNGTRTKLTEEQTIDLLISLVYSGYETVSTTSMMAVKYLHDHPTILEKLRDEHLAIRRGKLVEDAIDWNDYKSMHLTHAVIFETLRLATVVNGVLRKTTQDIDLKGFTIPKGWKIYVYTREISYNSVLYSDPSSFNPWRWLSKNPESHHYFFAFGGGSRLCPGKEWGMIEITIFLHYFLTQYRWKEVGGDMLLKFPRVEAPNGLHIRVWDN